MLIWRHVSNHEYLKTSALVGLEETITGIKTTREECINRVENIIKKENLPYELIDMDENFVGVKTYITILCNKCDYEYRVKLNNFFSGKRCAKCKDTYKYTPDERVQHVVDRIKNEKLNYEFIEIIEPYHGRETKFKIRCNDCDYTWNVKFSKFIGSKHSKCPNCQKNRRYSIDERYEQIKQIIKDEKLPYVFDGFVGVSQHRTNEMKLKLKCKNHQYSWTPDVNCFVNQGTRCPLCNIKSKGELVIEKILFEQGVEFDREKKFTNCKFKKQLPFDFYLPSYNVCLEYDGIQHFKPTTFGGISTDRADHQFQEIQIRDEIKNNYCKNNGIKLIRFRYSDSTECIQNLLCAKLKIFKEVKCEEILKP